MKTGGPRALKHPPTSPRSPDRVPALPSVPPGILNRKGSRDTAGVPREVRAMLDAGLIETVNLCEWLVVDQGRLAERVFREHGWAALVGPLREELAALDTPTAPKRLAAIGRLLATAFPDGPRFETVYGTLLGHRSDVVRSWSGYMVGLAAGLSLEEKLRRVLPLAADANMAVRETAWFAVREAVAAELPKALRLLAKVALDGDANVRRFASEVTRPRGVWCRHIQALKDDPSPGLVVLEPLRSDPSKYVRDSVGNWLNDAGKSRREWLLGLCARWEKESPTPETGHIVRRGLRTIRKAEAAGSAG
ncbi:MAG: DNA alkylation repair protein [Verrucomicrobia bacterium]|nr:MAG: DNA alkylation repair protein [Verrucomicrobiota bacterium]